MSKCKYCNSSSYGTCTRSPHKKHEHDDTCGKKCVYCGSSAYGTCSRSPDKYHRHGYTGKCRYCGSSSSGTCYIMWVPKKDAKIRVNAYDIMMHDKNLKGCLGGQCIPERDFPKYMNLDNKKKVNIQKVISYIYPFKKINQAINKFSSKNNFGRIIIKF